MLNKKQLSFLVGGVAAASLVAGCASIGLGGDPDPRWADYASWSKVTDGETGDPTTFIGKVHAGPTGYRNVYVNVQAKEKIDTSDPRQFPVGSVLVKEQFKSKAAWESGKGGAVTVALKVSDDAPAPGSGNWIWADSLTGTAKESAFCSGCHTIALKHDFMFTGGGYHK